MRLNIYIAKMRIAIRIDPLTISLRTSLAERLFELSSIFSFSISFSDSSTGSFLKFIGFSSTNDDDSKEYQIKYNRMKENVLSEVTKFFRPEFLNRIDSIVVFHSLLKKHMLSILDTMLDEISNNLIDKGINLEVNKAAKEWICEKGFDPVYGARPLRRVIQDSLEDKISDYLLAGKLKPGDTALVKVLKGEINLVSKSPKKSETIHSDPS